MYLSIQSRDSNLSTKVNKSDPPHKVIYFQNSIFAEKNAVQHFPSHAIKFSYKNSYVFISCLYDFTLVIIFTVHIQFKLTQKNLRW